MTGTDESDNSNRAGMISFVLAGTYIACSIIFKLAEDNSAYKAGQAL